MNSASSGSSAFTPKERLARTRVRARDQTSQPDLDRWWQALTGQSLRIRDDEQVDLALTGMLGIGPDLRLEDTDHLEQQRVIRYEDYESSAAKLAILVAAVGQPAYLWLPVIGGIGVLDTQDADVATLSRKLMRPETPDEVEGDQWVLLSRDLRTGLLVNWDQLPEDDDPTRFRIELSVWTLNRTSP